MITSFSKLGAAAATSALLLSALAPIASASTTITVSGNGAFSNNSATLTQSSDTVVSQTNDARINNQVTSTASTGGNSSFANTGGSVTTLTGNASNATTVSNAVNANTAVVNSCGTCAGDTNVKISGNGVASDNTVNLDRDTSTVLSQANDAYIMNDVDSSAKTGGNRADYNTGGDVTILTGSARNATEVANLGNTNAASVGSTGSHGGSLSAEISGNGAFSDNAINANFTSTAVLAQNNAFDVYNNIDSNAFTGHNSAFANTGGSVLIGTGNASNHTDVLNDVNRNWANLGSVCDCLDDVAIKVAGNGAGGAFGEEYYYGAGSNDVNVTLDTAKVVAQDNDFDAYNDVDGKAKTGHNDVSFSTGPVNGDPAILTGSATSDNVVTTAGNTNTYGATTMPTPMPSMTSLMNSWAAFWAFWSSSSM